MKKNIVIIGAAGRMGRALCSAILKSEDLALHGAIEYAQSPLIGTPISTLLAGEQTHICIRSDLNATLDGADAVIDFSIADVLEHVQCACAKHVPCVIGSTALDEHDIEMLKTWAQTHKIVLSTNMSVGVNWLFHLVKETARKLSEAYDIEIVEMHHKHKKDAPSGTAKTLLEKACEGRHYALDDVAIYGRKGLTGERPTPQIAVHALRGGDVAGDHTVIFAAEGERIELTHKASNRETFALGALDAARFLCRSECPNGFYSMGDVLGIEN